MKLDSAPYNLLKNPGECNVGGNQIINKWVGKHFDMSSESHNKRPTKRLWLLSDALVRFS